MTSNRIGTAATSNSWVAAVVLGWAAWSASAGAADRAGALATFFTAANLGLALPVLGLGIALQFLTPRVTLLIFAVVVGLGILAAGVAHHREALS